jgi:cellobiose-specific phosphotransferase system component IIC
MRLFGGGGAGGGITVGLSSSWACVAKVLCRVPLFFSIFSLAFPVLFGSPLIFEGGGG